MIGKLELWFESSGWIETSKGVWLHIGSQNFQATRYIVVEILGEFTLYNNAGKGVGTFKSEQDAKDAHATLVEFSKYMKYNLKMKAVGGN